MAYVTDRAPFSVSAFTSRIVSSVRVPRKAPRSHYDPRISEQELNRRALDRLVMQAICARSFA